MGLPSLKESYFAAQLRYLLCWCKPDYTAKWKEMEKEFGGHPIQSLTGDKEAYNKIKNKIDSIILFTLELWYKIIKTYGMNKDIHLLKWDVSDSNFKPAKYDKGFKQWHCTMALTLKKNITNYIKEKRESDLNIEISDKDWLNMWKMHQTATNLQMWREFSNLSCWRECGALSSDHSHVFWKCDKVQLF